MRLVLFLFSAVFLIVTMALASRKELRFDECFTTIIAFAPRIGDIWTALATGADIHPPLGYLAVRASRAIFGPGLAAPRLPSALGFLVMSLCLYRVVARWLPRPYALAAMLFPLVTVAYSYAYEARSYALVLGFVSLALLFWQEATDGSWRRVALIGLSLSLAAAVSSHYYAVFAFIPLAAGELTRTYLRKRLDVPIWLAFAVGLFPLILLAPFIRATMGHMPTFWARVRLSQAVTFYPWLLQGALPPLVVILILDTLMGRVPRSPAVAREPDPDVRSPLPVPLLIAAVGFALLPVLTVAAVMLTTGAFRYHYALPAVIGLSLVVTDACYRYGRGRVGAGMLMALVFGGWFIVSSGRLLTTPGLRLRAGEEPVFEGRAAHEGLGLADRDDLPIMVPDMDLYLELFHSLSRSRASRLAFVSKSETRTNAALMLDRLTRWTPIPLFLVDYPGDLDSFNSFYVYRRGTSFSGDWFLSALLGRRAQITYVGERGDYTLFVVKSKPPPE